MLCDEFFSSSSCHSSSIFSENGYDNGMEEEQEQEKEHMRVTVDNVIEEVNGKLFVIVIDVLTELKHRVTILFVLIFFFYLSVFSWKAFIR